jgi:hypothetical protein
MVAIQYYDNYTRHFLYYRRQGSFAHWAIKL